MLLQNKRRLYDVPGILSGGALINEFNNFKKSFRNQFTSANYDKQSSLPLGTEGIYSYMLPIKAGGLVSHTVSGDGNVIANQSNGINIVSNMSGTVLIVVGLSLVINLFTSLSGSGQITGSLAQLIQIAASLAGTGQISAALGLLAGINAILTGTGNVTANLRGTQTMSSDITPFTPLSPQNLASAVWQAIASEYNDTGTMGQKLNTASSGGVDYAALTNAVWSDSVTYASGTKGYGVDNSGGSSPTVVQIRQEMDTNSVKLDKIEKKTRLIKEEPETPWIG